ncbi:MAG: ABC transporter ATP-binding protein [Sporolactobacillus sp.]|jgi:ABC-2 type transport system ATP-binding protein|nr:ABC transporter ATP-binding protein [Sporolactobacillus sp.]
MNLTVENITKTYHQMNVLNRINLTFAGHHIYGLLGRNGAGKSTLLNIINNRVFPTKGTVYLDKQLITENEQALDQVFLMSEDDLFPDNMIVQDAFHLAQSFYGGFDTALANKMVAGFELNVKQKFRKLSTGYRSIAKLIIALCVPVQFVFLDEPTLGLDATNRDLFYQTVIESFAERPRTFVLSTHLIAEIANLIDRVIIIDHGKIIENTTTDKIKASGATVSGPKDAVLDFTRDMDVIGRDQLGGLLNVYVRDYRANNHPANVSVTALNLQTYFVKLTQKGGSNS